MDLYQRKCKIRILKLQEKLQNARPKEKDKIEETIYRLSYILNFLSPKNEITEASDPKENILINSYTLMRKKQVLGLIKPFSKEEKITLGNEPVDPKLSKLDTFTLVYDFFKETLDNNMFRIFENLFKRRNELIYYYPNPNTREPSRMIYLPFYREPHIFIKETSSVETYSTLCHEYAHAIISMMHYQFNPSAYLAEIPSEFFETLSLDYLKKEKSLNEFSTDLIQVSYIDYLEDAKIILLLYNIFKKCQIKDHINLVNFKNAIDHFKEQNNDPVLQDYFDFEFLSSFPCDKYLNYSIGQVMEQILFLMYYKNPSFARYTLNKLIYMNWHKPFWKLKEDLFSLGLEPTEQASHDYKQLIMNQKSSCFRNNR